MLALLHDMEEAVTGDLTPSDKRRLTAVGVLRAKARARSTILRTVPSETRKEFRRLWTDLDEGKTREAILVKDVDKLEMAFQASHYEGLGTPHRFLSKFYKSALARISDDSMNKIVRRLAVARD